MERIDGKNIYEYRELDINTKKEVLEKIVHALKQLHSLGKSEADRFSVQEAYITKTFSRLNKVRDLVPFMNEKFILLKIILSR